MRRFPPRVFSANFANCAPGTTPIWGDDVPKSMGWIYPYRGWAPVRVRVQLPNQKVAKNLWFMVDVLIVFMGIIMVDIDKLYCQTNSFNSFPVKNRVFTKWKTDVIFGAWWPWETHGSLGHLGLPSKAGFPTKLFLEVAERKLSCFFLFFFGGWIVT